ncbi:MAG TPA: hypothetical protein DGB72_05820 [Gemmatimonadetes bacterium]|nr:hypothetical protein [Gemmatimonadota bacterium]
MSGNRARIPPAARSVSFTRPPARRRCRVRLVGREWRRRETHAVWRQPAVSFSVLVSNYPALANVGGIAQIDSGGAPIAAVRTGASTFAAFSLICPHFGCTVGINGSAFRCPCHGAQFASTGTWIGGQRTTNLAAYGTSYDATTGELTITN